VIAEESLDEVGGLDLAHDIEDLVGVEGPVDFVQSLQQLQGDLTLRVFRATKLKIRQSFSWP
jgi:hypothetical protein